MRAAFLYLTAQTWQSSFFNLSFPQSVNNAWLNLGNCGINNDVFTMVQNANAITEIRIFCCLSSPLNRLHRFDRLNIFSLIFAAASTNSRSENVLTPFQDKLPSSFLSKTHMSGPACSSPHTDLTFFISLIAATVLMLSFTTLCDPARLEEDFWINKSHRFFKFLQHHKIWTEQHK